MVATVKDIAPNTILDVRNLQVQFDTDEKVIQAVDGISFQIEQGETLGVVGESGSGKSVTALAVMGLLPNPPGKITHGEIWFRGNFQSKGSGELVDLNQLPESRRRLYRGSQISTIFQEPMSALNPVFTIGFQLTESIRQHRQVSDAEARRQAIALLQEVQVLPSDEELRETAIAQLPGNPDERTITETINRQKQAMLKRYPHQLSGGQLQRVTIAMAISGDPRLLVADEPTTALDVTVQAAILNLLRELRSHRHMSLMFITHDLGVIAEIADKVAVMYQGQIVESGSVWEIFSNPQHPYTQGLLACRPQPEKRLRYLPTIADFMQVKDRADSNGQDFSEMGDQVSSEEVEDRLSSLQKRESLLSVQNLQVGFPIRGVFGNTKRYAMAVNGVSFDLFAGETLGLVGESGCGKTTLARALLRLVEPMSGTIWFDGENVTNLTYRQLRRLRRQMQIIFQDPFSSLNPRMTIGSIVMEPLNIHQEGGTNKQKRERVAYLLERVGLDANYMKRYPHEFSGGQRQRVCIARALANYPKFIVCDESVSALDVSVQAQVLNLLKELQQEFDLTYIFISHDLGVVKFMSDRIMVMNRGKIEEIGPAEQIYRQPQTDYTRTLIDAIPTGDLASIQKRLAG